MEKNDIFNNFQKKILCYKSFFQKNIFDEVFLDEKDKALTLAVLSDVIPEEIIKKTKKKKIIKRASFKYNEEEDTKNGSNIVLIGPKIADDNDNEFHDILNEQIFKIIRKKKISCKNTPNRRRMRKKI